MNIKKSLENRIRGWLPKESKPLRQGNVSRALEKIRLPAKNKSPILWGITGFLLFGLFVVLFQFNFSILAISLIAIASIVGVLRLALSRIHNKFILKFLSYFLLLSLVFVIGFTSFGFYVFQT